HGRVGLLVGAVLDQRASLDPGAVLTFASILDPTRPQQPLLPTVLVDVWMAQARAGRARVGAHALVQTRVGRLAGPVLVGDQGRRLRVVEELRVGSEQAAG